MPTVRAVRSSLIAAAVLLNLVAPARAVAGETDVRLFAECRHAIRYLDGDHDADLESAMACIQFLNGIKLVFLVANSPVFETCMPEGVGSEQTVRIVVKWLGNHPERLNVPYGVNAMWALQNAFPCPIAKPGDPAD